MMREIKFRAWTGTHMVYATLQEISSRDAFFGQVNYWSSDFPVMQFTGILDKNGKEIYEGDVLHVWPDEKTKERLKLSGATWSVPKQIVVWSDVLAGWAVDDDGSAHSLAIVRPRCEVIGNTYEHPHLSLAARTTPNKEK